MLQLHVSEAFILNSANPIYASKKTGLQAQAVSMSCFSAHQPLFNYMWTQLTTSSLAMLLNEE